MLADRLWMRWVVLAIAVGLVAVYLFPVYWMYITAFKSNTEAFANPPTFWPQEPKPQFLRVWQEVGMATYMRNSAIIASGTVALTVLIGTGCAYALARVRTVWMDAALFAVLMMQVLPSSLMITPIFVAYSQIGLIAWPRTGVILATAAKVLPLYIVLVRAAFTQVPRELEEAALVDGNSRVGAFLFIAVPLARNGILVTAILIFLQSMGEYVYSRSLITDRAYQPATVGLQFLTGPNATDWSRIMTFAAIYVTPILALFVILQRKIVAGLTSGALK
ncbi:MAG: carbohydrate ABC transporter permease [Paracoccaceae bacterium]